MMPLSKNKQLEADLRDQRRIVANAEQNAFMSAEREAGYCLALLMIPKEIRRRRKKKLVQQ